MKKLIAALALTLTALLTLPGAVQAQQGSEDGVWIQVAARPSLREAQAEAQEFAARLPDVSGFALSGGWYGVVLGPYARDDAERVLQVYRAEGQIPRDSFIAFSRNLRRQFWPVSAGDTGLAAAPVPAAPAEPETAEPETAAIAPVPPRPDETLPQAQRSERALSRDEKKLLQVALQAEGFYRAAIDGSFGRGTRASMADWQAANGYDATGVLTTAQRAALLDAYNRPLTSVGMTRIEDTKAGIALQMPAAEVSFSSFEPPFVHYDAKGSLGARVLLISQPGSQRTLYGLYDIMQTLEIVPLEGPRKRSKDSFTIEGRGSGIVSYTEATLKNGEIKGFTLVWPEGDDKRRERVLAAMKSSFTRLDGVLDPAEGAGAQQSIDLIAGLQVRKPRVSRTGFFVDAAGNVITTSDAVANCTRITLDHDYRAEILNNDPANGLAVLRPAETLAPQAVAEFSAASPRLQSEIAVSGYSYEGILGAPTLTWGRLADVKSLDGNAGVARLALAAQPGDAGGPVLDATGAVVGMLLPQEIGDRQLPEGVSFAANAEAIRTALDAAGLTAGSSAGEGALPPAAMNKLANGMTVLVSCWD
jgi:peptidoglycan hydrolase-like protein with peptidoglycan-binding domain